MKTDQCAACGSTDNLHYHHLIPRSLGGSDDETNLITLCGDCHAKAHGVSAKWRTSELTRTALARKKAKGERVGHIPFGHRLAADGVHLEEDPAEQEIVLGVQGLRASGMSLRQIAAHLNENGITKRDGKPWNHVNLHRLKPRSGR